MFMTLFCRPVCALAACLAVLGGCGGADAVAGTTPPSGGRASPTASTLTGRIWHAFSDLGNPSGTFTTNPRTGDSVRVQPQKNGIPWADGDRFLSASSSSTGASAETEFVVRRTADQAVLVNQVVDGDFDNITPSPAGTGRILASWGEKTFGKRSVVVWDFDLRKLLFATPPSDLPDAFAWMPDGTLLRAQRSGAVSRIALGGSEISLGAVNWPEARLPLNAFVSPDGSLALIQLVKLRASGSIDSSDLWMMDLRSLALRRFTNNGLVPYAVWSPDGRTVAFAKDTGYSCSESTCMGSCTIWYADATASEVKARDTSGDAREFPLRRPDGSMTTLRCPVSAWTR
jgi:dipeptidyl aminopeptidase/acylaminoacyl peptidase